MNDPDHSNNPFPGLRSFTPEEDYLFFGREEQTMELLETLGTHRFVAVVGTSGSGKSSLVRCGLLSQLLGGKMLQAGTHWEVAVTHPGAAPMGHLADSLLAADLYDGEEEDAKARLLATLNRSHFGLAEAIRQAQLTEGTNFLLVVDQFEEIFRFNQGGREQRDAANEFVSMLMQAAQQTDVPVYIVLTMRSDFIGDCAEFENLAEAVNNGEYLIPRMNREQFKQSIEGPIKVASGTITPRLLQRLLNDLGEQADQLPCLQHALMRTWDQWKRSSHGENLEGRSQNLESRIQELEPEVRLQSPDSRTDSPLHDPLPEGEGKAADATNLSDGSSEQRASPSDLPLPEGEGRGEGEVGSRSSVGPALTRGEQSTSQKSQSRLTSAATRSLDLEDYDRVGRMSEALSRHADEIYDSLGSDTARDICAALFKAITVRESENRGIRRPQPLGRLAQIIDVSIDELTPIIEAYRQRGVTFLMPPANVPLTDDTVIDISHESLMRVWVRLRDWVEEEAQSVGIFHRLSESAELHESGKAGLYRDPELGIALGWREESHANAVWAEQVGGGFERAMAYLEQSRAEAESEEQEREAARQRELEHAKTLAENQRLRAEEKARSARRMKVLTGAAMVVAVIAIIATLFAVKARSEAQKSARIAEDQKQLATAAKDQAEVAKNLADQLRADAVNEEKRVSGELYIADMNRAGQAYQEGGMELLDELLDRHKPGDAHGEDDLRGPEWYFWRHASRREWASLPLGAAWDMAVAPDQKTVAWVGFPGNVGLIDVASRNRIGLVTANGGNSGEGHVAIAYSPDGETLTVSGPYPRLRRWDTRTWKSRSPDLTFPDGETDDPTEDERPQILDLTYSHDTHLLAAGTDNGRIAIWDTRTWQVLKKMHIPADNRELGEVAELQFSPDDRLMVAAIQRGQTTAGGDDTGRLLIWETDRLEATPLDLQPIRSSVQTLALSPDGSQLVTGHRKGDINLWDLNDPDQAPVQLYKARDEILRVRFSRSGKYLAASTAEGNAILVGEMKPEPRMLSRLKGHTKNSFIEFVGNEHTLWSAGRDRSLKVWDVRESGAASEIPDSGQGMNFSYLMGGRLAWRDVPASESQFGFYDGERAGAASPIRVFDVDEAQEQPQWANGDVFTIHSTSANGRFLAAQDKDRRIRLWDVEKETLIGVTGGPVNEEDAIIAWLTVSNAGDRVAWSETSGVLNSGSATNTVHLWNPAKDHGGPIANNDLDRISTLSFSADGSLLAASGRSGTRFPVIVWDIVSEQPIKLHSTPVSPATALAFSPDGNRLACGHWNNEITFINPRTGKPLEGASLRGHADFVRCLAFSPDGKTLFSASLDQTLRIWDVETGARLATLPALEDTEPTRLLIGPEGRWMICGLLGQPARQWRLDDARDPRRAEMYWSDEGEPAARRGDFERARAAARQAVQLAPDQAMGRPWFALAALALHAGDLDGFRQVRIEMLAHFGDKPYVDQAQFLAQLCTIIPATSAELEAGTKLADILPDDVGLATAAASHETAVIMGEYRRGHYSAALKKAERYQISGGRRTSQLEVVVDLSKAMSHHQLGNLREARHNLSVAQEKMKNWDEQYPGTPKHPSNDYWTYWMFNHALLQEAESLIEGSTTATN